MSSENNSSNGMGFVGLLTICFIVLKLMGYIAWSWWLVLSPIWITILILFIIVVFGVVLSQL